MTGIVAETMFKKTVRLRSMVTPVRIKYGWLAWNVYELRHMLERKLGGDHLLYFSPFYSVECMNWVQSKIYGHFFKFSIVLLFLLLSMQSTWNWKRTPIFDSSNIMRWKFINQSEWRISKTDSKALATAFLPSFMSNV